MSPMSIARESHMSVAGESSVNWSIQYLWPHHQSVSVVPLPVSAASQSVSVVQLPVSAASLMVCLADLTEGLSLSSDCQSVSVVSLSVCLCSQ